MKCQPGASLNFDHIKLRLLREEEEKEFEHEYQIPTLPDDLMLMIFAELTTNRREIVGRTCKRFRKLDFDLGRKSFNVIKITWTPSSHSVQMNKKYFIRGTSKAPIELSNHNIKLLRHAVTNLLEISMDDCNKTYDRDIGSEASIHVLAKLIESVRCERVIVTIQVNQDCSDLPIFSSLFNQNLENAQVSFTFKKSHNTKGLLMRAPKIDLFRVDFQDADFSMIRDNQDQNILDDTSLLNVIKQTNHAELCMGDYSVQGIIDAFELFCKSDNATKYFAFNAQSAIVDDFFSSAFVKSARFISAVQTETRWILDVEKHTMMSATPQNGCIHVKMFKVDNNSSPKQRTIEW